MWIRKQNFFFIILGAFIALTAFVISSGRAKRAPQEPPQKREIITSVPEVVSQVATIIVRNVSIRNGGRPDAMVVVEVENTSDRGIIAISLESKKGQEGYTVLSSSSSVDGNEPPAVIKAHEVGTLTMEMANILPDVPLQIGSVMYADGTKQGIAESLKILGDVKNHEKRATKKESPQ